MFLEPEQQGRFPFTARETMPGRQGRERFILPASAAVVEYQEVQKNTLIRRSKSGGDMPTWGRLWIEAATRRVLATELSIDDAVLNVAIDVRYQPTAEPGPGLGRALGALEQTVRDGLVGPDSLRGVSHVRARRSKAQPERDFHAPDVAVVVEE
jgi:hypothetical protein